MPYERYREAVDYLQRRLWQELPIVPVERALQHRIRQLLAHLGDPQAGMPVVHVGGSAGKGSTATMTASILHAAGLRTGLYTSPHLQTFIERIRVDDLFIDPEEFAETVLGLDLLVRRMHLEVLDGVGYGRPALVEVAFATGMRHFAAARCDAAVVEVGLGGRTDCTNVFDRPHVSVLTNVDYEHRERLGWTIASIAREKAAIARGGIVVTGARRREALDVIDARCRETGAELWRLGREIRLTIRAVSPRGPGGRDAEPPGADPRDADPGRADPRGVGFQPACCSVIDVRTPAGTFHDLRVPLLGAHQASNAALAVAAAAACARLHGWRIDEAAVRAGMERVRIPARIETMQFEPRVILDGAHNPIEMRALAAALGEQRARRGSRLHLVLGILADKDQKAMVRAIAPLASSVVVTRPPLEERAGDPDRMLRAVSEAIGAKRACYEPSPQRALDLALESARADDTVCVTGSMYLAGALRERWVPEERILSTRSADHDPGQRRSEVGGTAG